MKKYFKIFSTKFWWLYVVLTALLITAITTICIVFKNVLFDFSGWASLVASILTYIGSSFLGVVVFYSSWVQQYKQERVIYDISMNITDNDKSIWKKSEIPTEDIISTQYHGDLFYDNLLYVSFTLQNLNHMYPLKYNVLKVSYGLSKSKTFYDAYIYQINVTKDYIVPLQNNETADFYVGINKKEINHIVKNSDFEIQVYLLLFNSMGNKELVQINLDNNCGMTSHILNRRQTTKMLHNLDEEFI